MAHDIPAAAWKRFFTTTRLLQDISIQLLAHLSHTWHHAITSCLQQEKEPNLMSSFFNP
jgi:hypothetical protein